jgi:cell division septum initiation protein DivIVA
LVLSPEEIEGVALRRVAVGGYKADQVTGHLRSAAWTVRELLHEREEAKSECERLEQELEGLRRELARIRRRDELGAAFVESAQNTGKEIKAAARQEAELILKKASEHADRLRREVEQEHAARLADVENLKTGSAKLRAELRRFIKTLLQLIEPGPLDVNLQRHELMTDLERVVQAQRGARAIPGDPPAPPPFPEAAESAAETPAPASDLGASDAAVKLANAEGDAATGQGHSQFGPEMRTLRSIADQVDTDGSERVA